MMEFLMARRSAILACLFFFSFYIGVLLQTTAAATGNAFPDDGTYKEVITSSFEDCQALCEADAKTCRGASFSAV